MAGPARCFSCFDYSEWSITKTPTSSGNNECDKGLYLCRLSEVSDVVRALSLLTSKISRVCSYEEDHHGFPSHAWVARDGAGESIVCKWGEAQIF